MNSKKIGNFILELRKEKGLTQKQLADELSVTDKAVSRWETGKNYPDIELFQQLAGIFNVTVSELLEGEKISKEELTKISENQVVEQIQKNKKSKKKYRIIIVAILAISLILGYVALKENGIFDGVIYNKIDYYSNEATSVFSNVEGYISQRPKSKGEYIINDGFFFLDSDKKAYEINIDGACENGRYFYVQTTDEAPNGYCFIGEYRENQIPVEGISIGDLKKLIAQFDLSLLPQAKMYMFELLGTVTCENRELNSTEFLKEKKKFIFKDGILSEYKEDTISGNYFSITVFAHPEEFGHGTSVAYIYCEI